MLLLTFRQPLLPLTNDSGYVNALRMRDLAEAQEMGLERSLLVKAAALAAVSAISLPGVPLCTGIHRRLVGDGRVLRRDLR